MSKSDPKILIQFAARKETRDWLEKLAEKNRTDLSKTVRSIIEQKMVSDVDGIAKSGLAIISNSDLQELKKLRREHQRMLRLLKP